MKSFVHEVHSPRVVFGGGTVTCLAEEVDRLGLKRVLVLSTPDQEEVARNISSLLAERSVGCFAAAAMHTPVEVTEAAMCQVARLHVDGLVAVGGGSTIGLGKAIALQTDLPQIVFPTTYAGSEMTPIVGETKNGLKTIRRSPRVMPETVIYDVDLTLSLPIAMSVTSRKAVVHAQAR
jgi:maleylacetate reductase